MEVRREVKVFEVNYQCPECKTGFMDNAEYIAKGEWKHTCTECKATLVLPIVYPRGETVPVKKRGKN